MFEKGDIVVYGRTGVCKVVDITTVDLEDVRSGKLYYMLEPYNKKEDKIFTPIDNHRIVLRAIISGQEAEKLIDDMPNIDGLWVADDKIREQSYKECIKSCECREIIRIIKTVYMRKQERTAQGKKVTAIDERYMKMAEEALYSELAVALGIPMENMEKHIKDRIKEGCAAK